MNFKLDLNLIKAVPEESPSEHDEGELCLKKPNPSSKLIKLNKNSMSYFDFKFTPKILTNFNFHLPLKLFGTDVSIYPLKVYVTCETVEPKKFVTPI